MCPSRITTGNRNASKNTMYLLYALYNIYGMQRTHCIYAMNVSHTLCEFRRMSNIHMYTMQILCTMFRRGIIILQCVQCTKCIQSVRFLQGIHWIQCIPCTHLAHLMQRTQPKQCLHMYTLRASYASYTQPRMCTSITNTYTM